MMKYGNLVSWHKRTWGQFLARPFLRTLLHVSTQFQREMSTELC